ncbi:ParB/RepB/Spo0J family partition protein [Acidobacteria bacterium ACD]|nr:ParB/RepB/Spo0J family partition protein [Acidobacteria bacterium ACB2]MDL1948852.1 ParB/RepB/Spo0J family partition protein [Acidobacteria bacterium ACD]
MSRRKGLPERAQMRHDAHFVEQLFRPEDITIGRRIPVSQIEANPDQPRSILGDLTGLRQSIADKGVLEPILVRRRDDGRFTIISGERRFRAAMEAGLADVPCIEMDVDDAGLIEVALIENLQRKDLTPFEEADGYALLRDRHSYTHEEIARAVGKSRVTVTETLSLINLPQAVREECRRADITSKTFLLELGRLPDELAMLDAIRAWVAGESSGRDALRESRRLPSGATEQLASSRLPKSYELTYVPEGSSVRVSIVLRGEPSSREAVLSAVRELVSKIGAGELDLEKNGRFVERRRGSSGPGNASDPESDTPEPQSAS